VVCVCLCVGLSVGHEREPYKTTALFLTCTTELACSFLTYATPLNSVLHCYHDMCAFFFSKADRYVLVFFDYVHY